MFNLIWDILVDLWKVFKMAPIGFTLTIVAAVLIIKAMVALYKAGNPDSKEN